MMAEGKKISFGFSKISKKPTVVAPKKEEKEIQFIDCLEENSIKLVNGEEKGKEELVIPLKNGNILRDNMIEALKARKEEKSTKNGVIKNEEKSDIKEESVPNSENSGCETEKKTLTLDELAAKEILEDLKKSNESEAVKDTREIPATNITSLGEKESTLEDYENVPVNEFGLAMLRGMGWAPDKGIGKNGQVVEPLNPVLRPKGMGLGADKTLPTITRTASGEELVMKKNASLKIISGPYKNLYGKIEGFDELPGRIMVRLTLQNTVISINENLVQLVTSEEFNKNSKILNLNDYNKYYEEKQSKNDKQVASEDFIKAEPEQFNKKLKSVNNERNQNRSEDYSRKERRVSSDSEERFVEKRERPERRKEERYEKEIHSRLRGKSLSSEPEEKYRRTKIKREKRSSSSSSVDRRISKSHKKKRRERSSSSDYEVKKEKDRNSYKSESKGHSSRQSKKKSKHKKSHKDSSDSEIERKTSKKHEASRHKHSKKSRHSDSDSDERERRRKHKTYSRQRSTSRSPSRKKKSKHHRSRS